MNSVENGLRVFGIPRVSTQPEAENAEPIVPIWAVSRTNDLRVNNRWAVAMPGRPRLIETPERVGGRSPLRQGSERLVELEEYRMCLPPLRIPTTNATVKPFTYLPSLGAVEVDQLRMLQHFEACG